MTVPDKDFDEGREDGMLAAEYVLGLLTPAEHTAFAARIVDNARLGAEVQFWQSRFSNLDEAFQPVPAPAALYGKIEKRLFGTAQKQSYMSMLWNSVALWRFATGGAAAIAIVAIGLTVLPLGPGGPAIISQQYVATLEAADSDVRFVAVYDSASGAVKLAGLSGAPVSGRDYELWFIEPDQAPLSLGVIPVAQNSEVALPDAMRAKVANGSVFAITLEPQGGAPEGKPTGPVVASGAVQLI